MNRNSRQMITGKAFEYAILLEFKEKLEKVTNIEVIENSALNVAKDCFNEFDKNDKGRYLLTASFAVNFLIDIEPRLSNELTSNDILQLEIVTDSRGESGDVRDVLAIRLKQKWEIGVSAKNNHHAVKHSRLSNKINFGEKWLGISCSEQYFNDINPIFSWLRELKQESNSTKKWDSLVNYHETVYTPILNAFIKELQRIYTTNESLVASRLIEYLVGTKDFYKVIKNKNDVEIVAYNLRGTLNLPFKDIEPKFITPRVKLPTKINNIYFKEDSDTTIIIDLNNNWKLSFRIHNASSRVEPSLKFDINLLESPKSLFTNTLSLPKEDI